jgi:hypothetical protein
VLGLLQHSQLRLRESLGPWTTHEEVFEDELAIAALERGTAPAAYDLGIRRRVCPGTNNLVLGTAVWAVKAAGCFWYSETIADLSEVRQCP